MKIFKTTPLFFGAIFSLSNANIFAEVQTGNIIGTVKTCSFDEQAMPVDFGSGIGSSLQNTSPILPPASLQHSVTVYIPGLSFVAKTGVSKKFKLLNVPIGTYDLAFEDVFYGGPAPYLVENIEVSNQQVTDVGEIDICQDPFPPCLGNPETGCDIDPPCIDEDGFICLPDPLPAS